MKTVSRTVVVVYIILLFACNKEVTDSSNIDEISIAAPPSMVVGKWDLSTETDTTFYSDHSTSSSWELENWFYNFKKEGVLEIEYSGFVDSLRYELIDNNYIKIGWMGLRDASIDTITKLTDKELVFKHWDENPDNSKTKKIFYLLK